MNFETKRYENRRRGTKKWGRWTKIFALFLSILFLFLFLYFSILGVGDTLIKSWTYSLEKGATIIGIPDAFWAKVSPFTYKLYVRFFAPEIKLQAWTYKIDEDTTLSRVLSTTLQKPVYNDLTITILPWWNMYDIDNYLSEKRILEAGAFLMAARDHFYDLKKKYQFLDWRTSIEWFLYPDTYRILQSSDAYMILDKLLSEWQKKIGDQYVSLGKNAYNELILASIVEREERNTKEQPTVAGILAKRVKEGIPMGADATVCYEYAMTQKQCTPEAIAKVITIKSAYNTRNQLGYPPTPIANISIKTWESVMNKSSSEYYYYLHDNEGKIHYWKTLSEHNQNKKQYLQ